LITLSALIAVALATWSVQDPSLSHAIDGPVRNFLGTAGAIGADLLMQLFGLAATVFVLRWPFGVGALPPTGRSIANGCAWRLARRFGLSQRPRLLPAGEPALAAAERPRRRHRRRPCFGCPS